MKKRVIVFYTHRTPVIREVDVLEWLKEDAEAEYIRYIEDSAHGNCYYYNPNPKERGDE